MAAGLAGLPGGLKGRLSLGRADPGLGSRPPARAGRAARPAGPVSGRSARRRARARPGSRPCSPRRRPAPARSQAARPAWSRYLAARVFRAPPRRPPAASRPVACSASARAAIWPSRSRNSACGLWPPAGVHHPGVSCGMRSARPRRWSSRSPPRRRGCLPGVASAHSRRAASATASRARSAAASCGLGLGLASASASLAPPAMWARTWASSRLGFALADLGLDVGRGQGCGPVVLVHGRLELAPAHRPQQGRLVGQLQGPHGRVERLRAGAPARTAPGRSPAPGR